MRTGKLLAAVAALVLCNGAAAVAQTQHGGHDMGAMGRNIVIEGAWARASVGRNGAAFVTVVNKGGSDDRLVAVKSDISPKVELHTHIMDGTVMRMRKLDDIPVPAGKSVTLKPGGLHVMIVGLKKKLVEGESFPLTLVFEKAGEITVPVAIKALGAMDSGHGGHGGPGGMRH